MTISSLLNFGCRSPPGRGLRRGENFWLHLTTANAQCLHLSERFYFIILVCTSESVTSGVGSSAFEALRETVYAEVATLISQNESCPHYLVELFRQLQMLSTDFLRQRGLFAIQDIVARYFAKVRCRVVWPFAVFCTGFPRLLESPGFFFLKIPGPGKSWKITLVLESPGS